MAVTIRKTNLVNPAARPRFTKRQLAAGFGGKRRRAAALKKNSSRNTAAKRARKRSGAGAAVTRPNLGLITVGLGNPAPQKRGNNAMAKTNVVRGRASRSVAAKRPARRANQGIFQRARRRAAAPPAKHRRRRNPRVQVIVRRPRNPGPRLADLGSMAGKAGWIVGGMIGARGLTQLVFSTSNNQAANTGFVGYASNIIAAIVLGGAVGKFSSPEDGMLVAIGGLAGVVARAMAEYSPIGSFVKQQLAGLGDYGMGIYLPTQFSVPLVPVDPQSTSTAQMLNPFPPPPALPAPAGTKGMTGLGARLSQGPASYGRYGAGRYN